jgi:hypothetical protein
MPSNYDPENSQKKTREGKKPPNEETLRTIIASCIGGGRVYEPNCRVAGAQQIKAGCNCATTRRTPKKTLEAKTRPREQKTRRTAKKAKRR